MAAEYVQPDSNQYALNGYKFLRLKQALASAGDIFESEQSAHAFALGPDSDISQVNIAYLDAQASNTFMSQMTLTPQRTFEGEIIAFNQTKTYAPSKRPGRILIWPAEIYDPTWRPSGFTPNADRLVYESPLIDIIQFFQESPQISSVRADKTYYYDILPFGAGNCYVAIPFYGRRYASLVMENTDDANSGTFQLHGVNFRISEDPASEVNLLSAAFEPLTFATTVSAAYSADDGFGFTSWNNDAPPSISIGQKGSRGLFDYLLLQFTPNDPADPISVSLRVVVSDEVG